MICRAIRLFLLAALSFAALATGATSAPAADPPTSHIASGPTISDALSIAAKFWGAAPRCAALTVYRADLRAFNAAGLAAPADEPPCTIWLDDDQNFSSQDWGERIQRCDTIVHEFGHLLGHEHDAQPLSPMNPGSKAVVYGCYRRFLPKDMGRAYRRDFGRPTWAQR